MNSTTDCIDVSLAMLEIHEENPDFLPKFISYFDGEKDPRNLMITFSILVVVMTEWDFSSCVQVEYLTLFMILWIANSVAGIVRRRV